MEATTFTGGWSRHETIARQATLDACAAVKDRTI